MVPRQVGITVDCADAAQLASFWERFLGYTRRPGNPGSPYVTIERGDDGPDGPPLLTFQTVPEPKQSKGSTSSRPLRRSRRGLLSTRCWQLERRPFHAPRQVSGRRVCCRIQPATSSASSGPTDRESCRARNINERRGVRTDLRIGGAIRNEPEDDDHSMVGVLLGSGFILFGFAIAAWGGTGDFWSLWFALARRGDRKSSFGDCPPVTVRTDASARAPRQRCAVAGARARRRCPDRTGRCRCADRSAPSCCAPRSCTRTAPGTRCG